MQVVQYKLRYRFIKAHLIQGVRVILSRLWGAHKMVNAPLWGQMVTLLFRLSSITILLRPKADSWFQNSSHIHNARYCKHV